LCKEETSFYVRQNGDVIPATGYRVFGGESNVEEALSGTIASRNPTYITFNDISNLSPEEAKGLLQLPRAPTHGVKFDTLQIIDDIKIPNGKWNTNGAAEAITSTFPEWGSGGGTQAITNKAINVKSADIFNLKNRLIP
jgi:hypothetical protein